jgi:nucleoside-diphosphate-sugar epimerase
VRAVVTGARGFVGREVVGLLRAGGHRVTAVDAELDLRDVDGVRRLIREARPELVLHLGGVSGPMVSADDPALVTAVNAVGTIALLDAAAGLPAPPRVVLASSIAAIETADGAPRTVYAATKRFIEDAADGFRARGLAVSAARLGSVYGPGRTTRHIVTDLARSIAARGVAEYDPAEIEPLVHIRDAARMLVALGERAQPLAPVYAVVQALVPHAELAGIVGWALGRTHERRTIRATRLRWTESLDSAPLLRDTGLTFEVGIADGVAETARAVTA